MKKRDFTSARAKEALLKDKDKYCGECCWFYGEDPFGYGSCPYRFAELQRCGDKCPITEKYVSKDEMRHHEAVLLKAYRYKRRGEPFSRMPDQEEFGKAIEFAYRFIKVFSNL